MGFSAQFVDSGRLRQVRTPARERRVRPAILILLRFASAHKGSSSGLHRKTQPELRALLGRPIEGLSKNRGFSTLRPALDPALESKSAYF
jgi:hypothetical protein